MKLDLGFSNYIRLEHTTWRKCLWNQFYKANSIGKCNSKGKFWETKNVKAKEETDDCMEEGGVDEQMRKGKNLNMHQVLIDVNEMHKL